MLLHKNKILEANVTGYSMNSFVDFDDPLGIVSWLGDSGAISVEMMDYALLHRYLGAKLDSSKLISPRGMAADRTRGW